jgi:hypothetical protein
MTAASNDHENLALIAARLDKLLGVTRGVLIAQTGIFIMLLGLLVAGLAR